MDRSEEFLRIAHIFVPETAEPLQLAVRNCSWSEFFQTVLATYAVILENEELVRRMNRLASTKEFSNDPTQNMQELSVQFEMKVKYIQSSLQRLKSSTDKGVRGNHDSQHRQLITQYLSKIMANHVNGFKAALKEHAMHVEERNKRVLKYGNVSSSNQLPILADAAHTGKYAMFSNAHLQDSAPLVQIEKNQALRNRRHNTNTTTSNATSAEDSSSGSDAPSIGTSAAAKKYDPPRPSLFQRQLNPGSANGNNSRNTASTYNNGQQMQQTQLHKSMTADMRFQQAERVESSIREMGQLFTQMASMIAEQSEVITRIEDDVELGHQNTMDGHASIKEAYEITKSNRSMIIKIFLILIFCIFLFLVWT